MSDKPNDPAGYLNHTRLVEEVPGVQESERYFLWHERKAVAHFSTKEEGERYCAEHGITIDVFEPFEP